MPLYENDRYITLPVFPRLSANRFVVDELGTMPIAADLDIVTAETTYSSTSTTHIYEWNDITTTSSTGGYWMPSTSTNYIDYSQFRAETIYRALYEARFMGRESGQTNEQREWNERQQREYQQRQRRNQQRKTAEQRALELLLSHLTPGQKIQFEQTQKFTVEGEKMNYEIAVGRAMNIKAYSKDGEFNGVLCAHPKIMCPNYDTMLAQKLMIEHEEQEFLKVAVKH